MQWLISGQMDLRFGPQRRSYYNIGDRVMLDCIGDGETGLFNSGAPFTWSKDSVVITGDSRVSVTQSSTFSLLTIESFRAEDAGDYVCSRPGYNSITATLNVIAPGLLVTL